MAWSLLLDNDVTPEVAVLPPFSTELPHETFQDVEAGVLLLHTKRSPKPRFAVGCAWEIAKPVNIEVLPEADCLALARQHEDLLIGLPIGTALQTIMTILPTTSAPAWEALRAGVSDHPAVRAQRRAIQEGLWHAAGAMHACLRAIPTLSTLRLPLEQVDPTLSTVLQTLLRGPGAYGDACTAALRKVLARASEQFGELRTGVEDTLRGLGHTIHALDAQALGAALARALDPMGYRPHTDIDPTQPLSEQALGLEAELVEGGIRFGTTDHGTHTFREEYRAQVLSLKRVTTQTYPGMLSAPRGPQGMRKSMNLWDAWHYPVSVVVNTAVPDQSAEESRLDWKERFASWQQNIRSENKTILDEVTKLKKEQLLTGGQMGWGRIHFVVWGHEKDLHRGLGRVKRAAETLRLTMIDEPTLGSTLFLQCLPLGCDPGFPSDKAISRSRRMTRRDLMHYLPLYGGFLGTGTPAAIYLNQRGEIVPFSPRDKTANPHMIVAGTSGGGKTYAMAHYLQQILALGAIAVVLDPLENFRGLCEYWDGEHISLDPNKPIFINPFYGTLDDAHVQFQAALLNEMASSGVDRLTQKEFAVLAAALKYFARTWDKRRGEPIMTNFVTEVLDNNGCFYPGLDEAAVVGRQLALKLSLYYGNGLHAKFVDGPNAVTFNKPFTLIEFAQLDTADELKGILFFSLFHLITKRFESTALAGLHKTIVGDELWRLLKHKATAEVIEKIIRTYRNFDSSAIFASQRASDFNSPVGEIIRGIADTGLFLKPAPGELPLLVKLFDLTPAEEAIFQRVGKHRGWASAFLRTEHGEGGIVRIIPDKVLDTLMSQSDAMKAKRAELRAKYGTLSPTIPELAYAA